MVFTVGLPRGMQEVDYSAHVRLLERDGIDVTNAPRVVEPVTKSRWVYAWTNKADAERAAAALRDDTEYDKWQVYEVPGPAPSCGPLGPLVIRVRHDSDGYVYGLLPTDKLMIRRVYPEARMAENLSIRTGNHADFEQTQGPYLGYVARILTGLDEEQIERLGGWRLIDSKSKAVLREASSLKGA